MKEYQAELCVPRHGQDSCAENFRHRLLQLCCNNSKLQIPDWPALCICLHTCVHIIEMVTPSPSTALDWSWTFGISLTEMKNLFCTPSSRLEKAGAQREDSPRCGRGWTIRDNTDNQPTTKPWTDTLDTHLRSHGSLPVGKQGIWSADS